MPGERIGQKGTHLFKQASKLGPTPGVSLGLSPPSNTTMTLRSLFAALSALALAACGAETDAPADAASTASTAAVAATPVPAGTYAIDGAHSAASFGVRHLGLSTVRGSFDGVSGSLTLGETLSTLQTTAVLDASTISTGNADRDAHLQSPDFFDVAQYPEITFTSTEVRPGAGDAFTLVGDLTMHGVTRPVTLEAEYLGSATSPQGVEKVAFTATGTLDRTEWGLTWNQALETGGVVVGDEITLEFEIEADRQSEATPEA